MTKEEILNILKENCFSHFFVDGKLYHKCNSCSVISETHQHLNGCDVQKAENDIDVVYNILRLYEIMEKYSNPLKIISIESFEFETDKFLKTDYYKTFSNLEMKMNQNILEIYDFYL